MYETIVVFRTLLAAGWRGLALGIESSRLARSCHDCHQLLELCAMFDTLIGDADGIYDPGIYSDRLLGSDVDFGNFGDNFIYGNMAGASRRRGQ